MSNSPIYVGNHDWMSFKVTDTAKVDLFKKGSTNRRKVSKGIRLAGV